MRHKLLAGTLTLIGGVLLWALQVFDSYGRLDFIKNHNPSLYSVLMSTALLVTLLGIGAIALIANWYELRSLRLVRTEGPIARANQTSKNAPEKVERLQPCLTSYPNYDGEWYDENNERRLLMFNLRNEKFDLPTIANNVTVGIDYVHASGDKFGLEKCSWWVTKDDRHEMPDHVFLNTGDAGRLIFMYQTLTAGKVDGIYAGERALQDGQWNMSVTVKSDNFAPLAGRISVILFKKAPSSYAATWERL